MRRSPLRNPRDVVPRPVAGRARLPAEPGLVACASAAGTGKGGILATDFGVADPNNGETISFGGPDMNDDLNESANLVTPSQDQFRSGGWPNFGQFKNHGDCISFVATRGNNPPSGP
jgi:hypothetical protein